MKFIKMNSSAVFPKRATSGSAGYDMYSNQTITIPEKSIKMVHTNIKVTDMKPNQVLYMFNRSSNPIKRGLMLANNVGVIDSDYSGELMAEMLNLRNKPYIIHKHDRIVQVILSTYSLASNDKIINSQRHGGFGSSGK